VSHREARKKKVVAHALLNPNNFPFEISIGRPDHCDEAVRAKARGDRKGLAFFRAGMARKALPKAKIRPDKPPPHHGVILLYPGAPRVPRIDKKANASEWNAGVRLCEQLEGATVFYEFEEDP